MEVFKDIEGYESLYRVSNLGNVIGLKRDNLLKVDVVTRKAVSYARVTLCKDGITSRFYIHRLVAQTFLPNPDNKPFVNHIDNNGLNNASSNLEWCTASENMQHSAKQGRQQLTQANITQAAVVAGYARYISLWKRKLGERFIAYYPAHQVLNQGEKPCAAVRYVCNKCKNERLSLTAWAELTRNGGVCPNCTNSIDITDEDIV